MSGLKVIIRKGEAFVRRWNPETRAYEEKRKTDQILSDVLQTPIALEATTFWQFFAFIIREADFYNRLFKAALYGQPLGPYIDEIEKPMENKGTMEHVEISWYTERFEGKLEFMPSFDGFGPWGESRPEGAPEKGGIGIEFTALNEYKDLPLKLDTAVSIHDLEEPSKPPFAATLEFTVYDVIHAILYEITWSGDISKGRKSAVGADA